MTQQLPQPHQNQQNQIRGPNSEIYDLVFPRYQQTKSQNTLNNQRSDLRNFASWLVEHNSNIALFKDELFNYPYGWEMVTQPLILRYIESQLDEGFAITTLNRRLSTIKVYAKLAFQAGIGNGYNILQIESISSYSDREKVRIDEKREKCRISSKKENALILEQNQLERIFQWANDDGILNLVLLLVDHGLRISEAMSLEYEDFKDGHFRIYRSKVNKTQVHKCSSRLWQSIQDTPDSEKYGLVTKYSVRTVQRRIEKWGQLLDIQLSAHDFRHYWATKMAHKGIPMDQLRTAGGWNSFAMPARYIADTEVANEGMVD